MTTLTVKKFISKSNSYIKKEIAKANKDGNSFLTKAEAKKLPKDLRDNFENFRVRAQENGVVTAKELQKAYTKYVAIAGYTADKNDNGLLSYAEAKSLPTDLKDNYADYRGYVTAGKQARARAA